MTDKLQRTERHVIKSSNQYYSMLKDFCHRAKNLYNQANYTVRQEFVNNGKWTRYTELDKLLRPNEEYPDYKNMPTAQSAQQLLKLLDKNWKSFFAAIKNWSKHKEKYNGKPNLPKYLVKDGHYILTLTNQEAKYKDGIIHFPKVFNGFTIKPYCVTCKEVTSIQQIRFIPHKNRIVAEVIYNIAKHPRVEDNGRYIGIDIGVDRLATVCNNMGLSAFAINGKPLKSINRYFNKEIAYYKSIAMRMNGKYYTKYIDALMEKRNAKIDDYLHKASRKIINYCVKNNISKIVIGKNDGWKQCSKMNKVNNQNFIQIPFARFIQMIEYKAEEYGIAVIETEESYTSGTSFIDDEEPTKEYYDKSRRVKRGLFRSNKGILINADLNGAYQILKKVVPIKWDSGCVVHPVVVNIV